MNEPTQIDPASSKSAATMIATVEAYFNCTDRHDIDGTVATMTDDCLLEFRSLGIVRKGRDQAIRQFFEERRRKRACASSVSTTSGAAKFAYATIACGNPPDAGSCASASSQAVSPTSRPNRARASGRSAKGCG